MAAIYSISGLQVVMSSIGKAIGPLVNIALLLFFAVLIFAIIGIDHNIFIWNPNKLT